jgi:putative transcriptional regulator
MESTAGHLLVATPNMGDENFDMTIVFMVEHTDDGALGVVVNRPTETPVGTHLPDLAPLVSPPDVFFIGGPVSPDHVIGVGRDGEAISMIDLDGVIEGRVERPDGLRLFAGYSGWAPGQLDGELAAGAWFVVEAFDGDVFGSEPGELWREVLRRQGGRLGRLSLYPDNPILN